MIVKRIWIREAGKECAYKRIEVHGWFLFGFIPIYIKGIKSL